MTDNFYNHTTGLNAPANNAVVVTPSDSTDLTMASRALYVGTMGDIVVDMVGGQTSVAFKGVVGLLPIRVTRVRAAGTTATDIVSMW